MAAGVVGNVEGMGKWFDKAFLDCSGVAFVDVALLCVCGFVAQCLICTVVCADEVPCVRMFVVDSA